MIEIRMHDSAKEDIRSDRFSYKDKAFVGSVLKELRDNPDMQESLLIHNDSVTLDSDSRFEINFQRWVSQYHGEQRNLWRLKPIVRRSGKPFSFRIVYAYRPPYTGFEAEIWILGVFKRNEFNYEDNELFTQRILRDYEQLD